ncbi:hypothetical protein PBI_MONET_88 [Mycobacterium phage Monet]|uniref:Uncharacterized protein n=1 Tax=Mycobacterium phage QTRlifeCrisis TaxID=3136627 RepID=A0AAU8GQQ5_9VIRU|nr:hypothetical protein PBI_TREDDLE_85 [Mycobacterium phage Treddle]AUX81832.1 hypothetical protein SEA_ACME_90 [Mycobacterium phage Acme]AUX82114.1 membrane protein [Mycobacterium phage Greg]AVI03895.1 hypothetical protein SEA_FAJEZEEL_89 [Mycobacterium phage Fajezeel]QEA11368.1 hypothetical protein SEA-BUTTONS_81 [Mycobacterium phage Buttons]QGJ89401.1 membrane protein [Mycobacterium phage Watermelon]WAB09044.1 hypothetical protein PBI_MONET_88 [Mycobacterium phage Monet]
MTAALVIIAFIPVILAVIAGYGLVSAPGNSSARGLDS